MKRIHVNYQPTKNKLLVIKSDDRARHYYLVVMGLKFEGKPF